MIALAIVSIAMVALLALTHRSIGVPDLLQRLPGATLLAQQKMAETEVAARHGILQSTELQGVFGEPYAAFRWKIDYAETPMPSVQMVTVTVLWGDAERNELVDLTSFIF